MVLGMLLAITTCPAMLGTQEAIRQSQSKNRREEHRAQRCNLMVNCLSSSNRSHELHGKTVVLKGSKLFVDTGNIPDFDGTGLEPHRFNGYFLPYPDSEYEGLVSTITDEAPILNWIYVHKDTYEVKYGVRDYAQPNLTGPWDCTRQDRRMTFEGWEGFAAVEVAPAVWSLYYDRDDNGLRDKLPPGTRVLDVELTRREKKVTKPDDEDIVTLDEMLAKQKQERAEEEQRTEEAQRSAEGKGSGEQAQAQAQAQPQQEQPQQDREPQPTEAHANPQQQDPEKVAGPAVGQTQATPVAVT
ncbi:hypothetical protein PG990_009830 [Apiospora arundinis]|uniref:Uncharacterized protein n=1 Tax=Apiospora arundinis TaxID=335852 RepID=A0ABR2ITY7_9PEZI